MTLPIIFDSRRSERHSDTETETQSNYSHDRNESCSPPNTPRMGSGRCPCNCATCCCGNMDEYEPNDSLDDDTEDLISEDGDEGAHGRHVEDDERTFHGYYHGNGSDADMTSTASVAAEPSSGEASWFSSMEQSFASIGDTDLHDLNHEHIPFEHITYEHSPFEHSPFEHVPYEHIAYEHIYISTILPLLPVDKPPFPGNRPHF